LKVEAFSIGFGPKIFSWKKDGIDYSWRWIPAGGFVALPQMVTSEVLEGKSKTKVTTKYGAGSVLTKAEAAEDKPGEVAAEQWPPVSPLSKILVAFAGPFMNVAFAFAIATLIYFIGLPVPVSPPIVGPVDPASPEAHLGIHEGDRVVMVDSTPIKSWDDIIEATILARTNVIPVVITREGVTNTYYLTATVNDIIGLKTLNLDPREHPVVGMVESDKPAAAAGMQPGDKIISVNGIPVPSQERMIDLISKAQGKPCKIIFSRQNQKLTAMVTPQYDPVNKRARIGITFSEGVYEIQHPTPWAQVRDVWYKMVGTFSALSHSKQTGVGAKDLSGPVGIFAMLAAQVNADYRLALSFLVLLNINLAIINLLPLPVLDGGHICMAILERIRGRALNPKLLESLTAVFATLLIGFMVYVSYHDIKRIRLFESMFHRGVQIEQPETNQPQPATPPVQP
jgi:regulator of sigma E protease